MNIWKTLFNFTPLGRLFGGRAKNIGSGLSSVASLIRENNYVGSLVNSITGAGLTGAEREANAFTAAQSELGRQWQEDMYNKYESPTAMMNQYREAGLNPALMYGDASSGSVGTNAGAGSSVSPGSSSLGFAQLLMSLAGLRSEIDLNKANAEAARAGAGLSNAQASKAGAETERTKALLPFEISDFASQISSRNSQISRNEAEIALTFANTALLESDVAFRNKFNEVNLRIASLNVQKHEQEIENLKRDYALSFAKEAEILANTQVLSQEAENLYVQEKILFYNSKIAKYEADIKRFENDKKEADRVWNNVGKGFSFFRDLGVGVGAVAAGAGRAAGAAVGGVVKSSSPILYGSDGKRVISSYNR